MTELTPHALAQTAALGDACSPPTTPPPPGIPSWATARPSSLRAAAQWLVDEGHAPGLKHEMVCILLAMYVIDVAPETRRTATSAVRSSRRTRPSP